MRLTIRLKKRKRPIIEFKRLAEAKDDLTRELYIFIEATRLHIQHGLILATPAKKIKRMKLRQIEKDLEFLVGDPKTKTNYKIVGVTDSREEKTTGFLPKPVVESIKKGYKKHHKGGKNGSKHSV